MSLGEINSSSDLVDELTKEMMQIVADLQAVPECVIDCQTTLSGNMNAQQAIELLQTTLGEVTAALSKDINNLQMTAEEFERVDQQSKVKFDQLEP